MFENRRQPVIPSAHFAKRVALSIVLAGMIAAVALSIGVVGYHFIAELPWIDAFLDASMILGGMGPVSALKSDAAKLFASAYALFSGLVFISVVAVTLAPIMHRILHKFHIDETDIKNERVKRKKT